MDVDYINEQWAIDSNINKDDIFTESLRTANLHQKYLQMLMQCKNKLLKYANDYAVMRDIRSQYYSGSLSLDELKERGWSQYQGLKPLKTDMHAKLEADSELAKIKLKVQYVENMIIQLEYIMNSLRGRDWAVKNYIEWSKFQAGN